MSNKILHESIKTVLKQSISQYLSKTGIDKEMQVNELSAFTLFFLKYLITVIDDQFNREYASNKRTVNTAFPTIQDRREPIALPNQLGEINNTQQQTIQIDAIINANIVSQVLIFRKLYRYDITKRTNLLRIQSEKLNDYQSTTDEELYKIDTHVQFPVFSQALHEKFDIRNFVMEGDQFIMNANKVRNLENTLVGIIRPIYEYYKTELKIDILVIRGLLQQHYADQQNIPYRKMFIEGNALELTVDGLQSNRILFDLENKRIPNIRYGIFMKGNNEVIDQFIITNPILFNGFMAENIVIDNRDPANPVHKIII